MPGALEALPIRDLRRACSLACKASDAFVGIEIGPLVTGKPAGRFLTPDPQAATRRIILVTRKLVSWAHGEAETAVCAV